MSKYESVIILRPDLTNKKLDETILKIEKKLEEFAIITDKKDYGIRRLAYEIHRQKEGHYIMYQFETNKENNLIDELERIYRILDEVIKYITIKI